MMQLHLDEEKPGYRCYRCDVCGWSTPTANVFYPWLAANLPSKLFVRCVVISFCYVYNMSPYIAAFVARSFILESPLLQTFQKQAP